jgi:hypothetical protein
MTTIFNEPTNRPIGSGPYKSLFYDLLSNGQLLANVPLPASGRGPQIYEVEMPPGSSGPRYFAENKVPFNTLLLHESALAGTLPPSAIAKAALKANPNCDFLVPTDVRFTDTKDPRYLEERERIAKKLGVPDKQVFPVPADLSLWTQDEFLLGPDGFYKPFRTASVVDEGLFPQLTPTGTNDLGLALGLKVVKGLIGRGGDLQIFNREDGKQVAIFGTETLRLAADALGIKLNPDDDRGGKNFLLTLAYVMKSLNEAGIPLENIVPLGTSERGYGFRGPLTGITIGDVIASLTVEERRLFPSEVRHRLAAMSEFQLPLDPYRYHTDTYLLTLDGKTMFVCEDVLTQHPELAAQLKFFGFEVVPLPAGVISKNEIFDGKPVSVTGRLSYANAIQGLGPNGERILLLPTEAQDPAQPTKNDLRTIEIIQRHCPGVKIVLIGYCSATHYQNDWGPHCMSQVLPVKLRELPGR